MCDGLRVRRRDDGPYVKEVCAEQARAVRRVLCGTVADTPLSPTSTSASPQFTTARERNRAEVVALLERAGAKVSPSPALCVELGQRED